MNNTFTRRVYGVQIIKSKNSNYNADFSGAPRTLPDGTVYATDKVNKFNIRNYFTKAKLHKIFVKETIHKTIKDKKESIGPRTLTETYEMFFCDENNSLKKHSKAEVLKNLLTKLDVRLFGVTFAPGGDDAKGKNISVHGPVQISYGKNLFGEGKVKDSSMYTDQIGSPYSSVSGDKQTTLGSQTRSQEAHYAHHFSINATNLTHYIKQFENTDKSDKAEFCQLTEKDIQELKEAMALATTYYDSTSKKDSENELLLWIELKDNSEKIMKNFTELIDISSKQNKNIIDLSKAIEYIRKFSDDILKIEIYYDEDFTKIICPELPAVKVNFFKELNLAKSDQEKYSDN